MYKLYPNARRAHLKTGGNFPYLCRSAEVNLYIQVSACIQTQFTSMYSWNSSRKLFCAHFYFLTCLSSVHSVSQIADVEQPHQSRVGFGGLPAAYFLYPLSELLYSNPWLHSHRKVTQQYCFSYQLCLYTIFSVNFCVLQIHLLQFRGTRYAAIDPSMVSAEELEVQKISLHNSSEQEEE